MPISPFELQELPLSAKEIPHQAELGTQQDLCPLICYFLKLVSIRNPTEREFSTQCAVFKEEFKVVKDRKC